jgi:large subunit ribosomal protein L15e
MTFYKTMKGTFANEYKTRSDEYKTRLSLWSSQPSVSRIDKPTNIARARELGYKAKQGVVVVRVRVLGGKKKRQQAGGGRKPSKSGRFFSRQKSPQSIAEERAATKFSNCEVMNSYFVGEAGTEKYFEVIMLDRTSPVVLSDAQYSQVVRQKGRASRGLTYQGRKHRGIRNKGFGTARFRPSKRANNRG